LKKKSVLVTGIGGNVGQGILRNIRALTQYNIKLVGCNIDSFSAGNHLCDVFYKVPYAFNENYVKEINKIIYTENIDLVIPSTDYEIYYLSLNRDKLLCQVAASDVGAAELYLDKYKSYLHHKKFNIPFAESFLPSAYNNQFRNIIVKPRKGRGSRGLKFNPTDMSVFNDEEFIVQKSLEGLEITTAFYVTKDRQLHGLITLARTLHNGTTDFCYTVFQFDTQIKEIIHKIIKNTAVYGSLNIQSIVNNFGQVIPFEINCRISGTNSIRSNFGFNDVDYTLSEYLYQTNPEMPKIIKGSAVRIYMDVVYKNTTEPDDLINNRVKNYIF